MSSENLPATGIMRTLALLISCWCTWAAGKKNEHPVERGYQVAAIPQGIHYYTNAAPAYVYHNLPAAVYVPGQVGLVSVPTPDSSQPPSVSVPSIDSYEPPSRPSSRPSRPSSRPSRPSYSPQGPPAVTVDQSIDLTGTALPGLESTYAPPKTYESYRKPYGGSYRSYMRYKSPLRNRPGRPVVYTHSHKGHLHTHYLPPYPPPPPPSVVSFEPPQSSYLPPTPSFSPTTATPPSSAEQSAEKPYNYHAHPPTPSTSQLQFSGRYSSSHPNHSSSHSNSPVFAAGGLDYSHTQALIGPPGIIKNYDANLPVKIPSPKPNLHQVNEILKNAELHFVDVVENHGTTPTTPSPVQHLSLHAGPLSQYQQHGTHTATFQTHPVTYPHPGYQPQSINPYNLPPYLQPQHGGGVQSFAQLHRFQSPNGYQSNRIEQDSSSDTIKIPVAIFKGVVPAMFPLPMERSDEESLESVPADFSPSQKLPDFTPSVSSSDWTPMVGNTPAIQPKPKQETLRNLNHFGDNYFEGLSKESLSQNPATVKTYPTKSANFFIEPSARNLPSAQALTAGPDFGAIKPVDSSDLTGKPFKIEIEPFVTLSPSKRNEKVGDIISGRIPGSHNPFESLGTDGRNRKGSVVDGSSSTTISKVSNGSNLVVSSSIKFS